MGRCVVGILPCGKLRQSHKDVAGKGYKRRLGEPTVWFPSTSSLAAVLSDDNRALLRLIRESKPRSLGELSELSGRKASNLSRTLKTMASYGLVELRRAGTLLVPTVKATEFVIVLD